MTIYTVVRTSRYGRANILYCGTNKAKAEEEQYMDRVDEPSPDKDEAYAWKIVMSEFPDWK